MLLLLLLFTTQYGAYDSPEPTLSNGHHRRLQATQQPQTATTIYADSLEPGWTVQSDRGVRIRQQVAGAVNSGSQAFCATLPAASVSDQLQNPLECGKLAYPKLS